jgi:hypothetical protein
MRPIRLMGYPPAQPTWSRGAGSTQANPGLRPSGHSLCECSLRLPASAGLRPILAFALRAIRFANVRSGILPPQDSGPSWPSPFGPFAARMFVPASCLRRTQANPGLRPSGHLLRKCSLRLPASTVGPCGFASRETTKLNTKKGHFAAAPFHIWWRWREYSGPSWPSPFGPFAARMFVPASCLHSRTLRVRLLRYHRFKQKKGHLSATLFLFGGGGGSRTRVRRRLTPSTTCLAHRSISSSGSTACETHRLTSLKSFALLPSDGGIRLSHDNDGTSTSIGTSGFPAYALSGECVVVVVGN